MYQPNLARATNLHYYEPEGGGDYLRHIQRKRGPMKESWFRKHAFGSKHRTMMRSTYRPRRSVKYPGKVDRFSIYNQYLQEVQQHKRNAKVRALAVQLGLKIDWSLPS